ncbi:hypothetical protein BpHYR1_032624 [Brachionus plicatilis]|uniref:RNA-directed DNA polymerase from mobile element jockey-like n=1 Tax=Brachionus plicatilis TaxID=10195 RepID=A0A3M7QW36_BRAPC|nr:hypothetical protein BpHYR1_032624 [Brachionus plicatilis]
MVREISRKCTPRDVFLTNRIIPYWNKLSEEAVTVKSLNSFKGFLDLPKLTFEISTSVLHTCCS